jgi:hypothetical protein
LRRFTNESNGYYGFCRRLSYSSVTWSGLFEEEIEQLPNDLLDWHPLEDEAASSGMARPLS